MLPGRYWINVIRGVHNMKVCLLIAVLVVTGCSTDSYYRGNTRVTVKRFIGIPYLEKEETVKRRQPGADSLPVQ
jgi:hypothetical protein